MSNPASLNLGANRIGALFIHLGRLWAEDAILGISSKKVEGSLA